MSAADRDPLRWYPPSWRARYGDELRALIEDHCGTGGPGRRERASLARNGIAERARVLFLLGHGAPDESRWRGGALVVLVGWALFVLGGAAFAKASEHFAPAVPSASRALPRGAYGVVYAGGIAGVAIVVLAALLALPGFARLVRSGGWWSLRGHVARAAGVTVAFVACTASLAGWAHSLSPSQRNGGSARYGIAFVAWAVLVAMCLASWTAVVVAAGRRVPLSRRVVRCEAALAVTLGLVMLAVTAATATWWGAMAASAPWFLAGTARGTAGVPFDPALAVAMAAMGVGLAVGAAGTVRIARR